MLPIHRLAPWDKHHDERWNAASSVRDVLLVHPHQRESSLLLRQQQPRGEHQRSIDLPEMAEEIQRAATTLQRSA